MDSVHRETLKKSFSYFVNNLHNVESVCDGLINDGVLDNGMVDSIVKKKPVPAAQTRELLITLPRRGQKAYISFVNALKQSNNDELAEYLEKTEGDIKSKHTTNKNQAKTFKVQDTLPYSGQSDDSQNLASSQTMTFTDWPDLGKGLCNINKKYMVKPDDAKLYDKLEKDGKVYPLQRTGKGKFLLVCTKDPNSSLPYTSRLDFDVTSVEQFFVKCLGYENIGANDRIKGSKSTEEIMDFFRTKVAEIEKDTSYKNLVVAILTGGNDYEPAKVYDKSGAVIPTKEICDIFLQSTVLKGKPKIFIIQSYNFSEMEASVDELEAEKTPLTFKNEQNHDDLFVVSAYPRTELGSWMAGERVDGSYFIQALIEVIRNNACRMSFIDLMQEVSRYLSNTAVPSSTTSDQAEKQQVIRRRVAEVVMIEHCVNKEFYFSLCN